MKSDIEITEAERDARRIARQLVEDDGPLSSFTAQEIEGRVEAFIRRCQLVGPDRKERTDART